MRDSPAASPGRAVPFVLAACTAVSVLSTDLITPSIPDLPGALGTTITAAQMTVSVNLAAYALAQLVHGPVADAVGRRRLLIGAFLAFTVVSALCAMAVDIGALLAGRFLQGLVSSVPSVVVVLMIRELYASGRAVSVMALYGLALGVAPALGPLIGGYLHVWFGWQAGFWLIAALALAVTGLLWWLVPESLPARTPLNLRATLAAYGRLATRPAYVRPALAVSLMFGALFAYITTAPVVFIELLGLAPQRFGLTSLAIVAAFMASNALTARLARGRAAEDVLRVGGLAMAAAMVPLLAPLLLGHLGFVALLGAMSLYAAALALVLAAGPLVVMGAVAGDEPVGPASALLGSLQLALSAAAGYLSALLYDGTALPMALVIAGFVLSGAALLAARPGARGDPVASGPAP